VADAGEVDAVAQPEGEGEVGLGKEVLEGLAVRLLLLQLLEDEGLGRLKAQGVEGELAWGRPSSGSVGSGGGGWIFPSEPEKVLIWLDSWLGGEPKAGLRGRAGAGLRGPSLGSSRSSSRRRRVA
jgi:hypothetical protein